MLQSTPRTYLLIQCIRDRISELSQNKSWILIFINLLFQIFLIFNKKSQLVLVKRKSTRIKNNLLKWSLEKLAVPSSSMRKSVLILDLKIKEKVGVKQKRGTYLLAYDLKQGRGYFVLHIYQGHQISLLLNLWIFFFLRLIFC